ncbi:MAG: PfkB family carbohydrate kinase [Brevibacterium sp.]
MSVTLSPALDLTLATGQLELGSSQRIAAANARLGGKGINVARVLAELGCGVYVQGPVAREHWPKSADRHAADSPAADSPAGNMASTERTDHGGLIWDLTDTESPLRRSYAIVEDSGRATVLNEHAHAHPAEVWAGLEAGILRRMSEPAVKVLVISGSTPADLPAGFHDRVIAAAHEQGATVIVDTSGPGLHLAARAGVDWVKPNSEELAEIAGADKLIQAGANELISAGANELIRAGANELIRAGAGTALVSLGSEGMVFVDDTGVRLWARLDRALRGNPTGAGDAAVAALARWLADRASPGGPAEAGRLIGSRRPAVMERLRDDEVEALLTDSVAISAAAILMPQAGQIHPSWGRLREDVVLGSQASPIAPTDTTSSANTDSHNTLKGRA